MDLLQDLLDAPQEFISPLVRGNRIARNRSRIAWTPIDLLHDLLDAHREFIAPLVGHLPLFRRCHGHLMNA